MGNEIIFAVYMLLKAITTSSDIREDAVQNVLGTMLGLCLALAVLFCLVFQSVGVFVKPQQTQESKPKQAIPPSISLRVQESDEEPHRPGSARQPSSLVMNSVKEEIPQEVISRVNRDPQVSSEVYIGTFREVQEYKNQLELPSTLQNNPAELSAGLPRVVEPSSIDPKVPAETSQVSNRLQLDYEIPQEN